MAQKFAVAALAALLSAATPAVADPGAAMVERLQAAVEAGDFRGLHGVLVLHEGKVLGEAYFPGEDQRWGATLGMRQHGPDTLHDIRSVTKPIVGLLYGIALGEGAVPLPDARLLAQFAQYADLAGDPQRGAITIQHALSMQMGIEWDETVSYADPRNSEIQMERADDRYRFVLSRPILHPPGAVWTYNDGAAALVAKLIEDGVGEPIDVYAQRVLFEPLGITDFEWIHGPDGTASAASGLRLTLPDLAKIGTLILGDGAVDGRQIVPAEWLTQSFTPHAKPTEASRYGLLWWLAPSGEPPVWMGGFGNGGQRLTVQPNRQLVIAVNAGLYNDWNAWRIGARLVEEFIAPAVRESLAK